MPLGPLLDPSPTRLVALASPVPLPLEGEVLIQRGVPLPRIHTLPEPRYFHPVEPVGR